MQFRSTRKPAQISSQVPALVGFMFLTVVAAAAVAISPKWGTILTVGLACGVGAMSVSVPTMVALELVLATVVAGSLEYFTDSTQGFWVAAVLPLLLAARAALTRPGRLQAFGGLKATTSAPSMWAHLVQVTLTLYLLVLVFSAVINQSPPLQVLVAAKNYVFVWAMLYVLLKLDDFERLSNTFWRLIFWTALAQLPVVLYQRFFIASKIGNTAAGLSWDAVSGTFGGGLTGGRSAAMALFIVVAVTYLMIRWRDRQMKGWRILGLIALMIPSVFLAEVKVSVIWIAFAGVMVFGRELIKRPLVAIFAILALFGLAVGILLAYNAMYYVGTYSSSYDLYEKQIGYIFDTNRFNVVTREIGRVASILFWWTENRQADLVTVLMGSGPGASRGASTLAIGEVARRYSYLVDTSTLTALLWDVGLLGALAFVGMGVFAALSAARATRNESLTLLQRNQAEATLLGLLLILSGVAYNRDAVDSFAIQLLLVFFIASALRWSSVSVQTPPPTVQAKPPAALQRRFAATTLRRE